MMGGIMRGCLLEGWRLHLCVVIVCVLTRLGKAMQECCTKTN
jgi:hypothetical protein